MANIKFIQFLFILSEMSKEFKVHEDFNLEHLSWDEENCHCDKPGKKGSRVLELLKFKAL